MPLPMPLPKPTLLPLATKLVLPHPTEDTLTATVTAVPVTVPATVTATAATANRTVPLLPTVHKPIKLLSPRLLRLMAMTTMHGPSRHMEPTSTPGGANLTTQLRPGLMTTSTTHVRSLLTTTSGPKTAMSTRVAKPATTATLPLLTTPPTVILTLRRLPLRATREHGLANTRTLMPMAVTRTSMRRSLTMTPAPKHTRPSLMMRGTTRMTTNGAHRLGVQTKMSTVLPLMELRPPRSRRATATDLAMSGRAHLLRAALPEVPTTMTLTLTCL